MNAFASLQTLLVLTLPTNAGGQEICPDLCAYCIISPIHSPQVVFLCMLGGLEQECVVQVLI